MPQRQKMGNLIYEDKTLRNIKHSDIETSKSDFEHCSFISCDFSNGIFSSTKFIDCVFTDCNLSMAKLNDCQLNNASFKGCKLLGINFSACTDFLFAVKFKDCVLDYSSFAKKKMPKTPFFHTSMKNVDFTGSDLTRSVFSDSDLTDAVFYRSILKEVDFLTALNYTLDPEQNNLKKARFSLTGVSGLLTKYGIHIE